MNVVPASLEADFNLRYSPALTDAAIRARIESVPRWPRAPMETSRGKHSAAPFLTAGGRLVEATKSAIRQVAGIDAELSTEGGTSDGRFVAPDRGGSALELGPVNSTIHQIDERVACADLDRLSLMYEGILERLLGEPAGTAV